MMPNSRGKLTPAELVSLGYTRGSERYSAPGDPRADEHGTISRRQAENDVYTRGGWRNRADYERRYQGTRGTKFRHFEQEAVAQGKIKRRAGPASEFSKRYTAARRARFDDGRRPRGPNSPMAKLLAYVGLRPMDADYNVGDTPPRR